MRRGRLLLACALLAPVAAGCDAAAWYRQLGTASFEELEPDVARAWLEGPGAALVQVRGPGDEDRRLSDALIVAPDALPDLPPGARVVVVVAEPPAEAYRLAARLARAGGRRVGVVEGGVAAWAGEARRASLPGTAGDGGAGG
jgi:rhodanese-related sulfurtransferase